MADRRWWIFLVACLGWMFDTFDQRLFILARAPAMESLLPAGSSLAAQTQAGTWMTAVFIAGWATGGLIFGVFGDRMGRVRTMALTIAIYSLFTGLSAFSVSLWDFGLYRFLTGLGIGGEFAAGAALIAEVMPARIRSYALGFMQVTAIVGTFLGTMTTFIIEPTQVYPVPFLSEGAVGWRLIFLLGAVPAFILLPMRLKVEESESWLASKAAAHSANLTLGGIRELLATPWRKVSLVGIALGFAGQLGIWAIGTWTPELMRLVLIREPGLSQVDRSHYLANGLVLKDIASAAGIMLFTWFAQRYGRRPAFAISFISSFAAVLVCFGGMRQPAQIWWMMPLIGITVWSVLGGYSIYFPELFPTRLRASGIGLCYNVARYLTAAGVVGLGSLLSVFTDGAQQGEALRPAAMIMASCFLVGLAALWFAPETRDRPLPD